MYLYGLPHGALYVVLAVIPREENVHGEGSARDGKDGDISEEGGEFGSVHCGRGYY